MKILMYHNITPYFNIGGITIHPKTFLKQMRYIKQMGFTGISVDNYLNLDNHDKKNKIILTFDDSLEGVYNFALPILQKLDFTATLFVPTAYIGEINDWDFSLVFRKFKHLTKKELQELDNAGWEIAAHTHTHKSLIKISSDEAKYEINTPKHILEEILQKEVKGFSYPYGHFNNAIKKLVKNSNYQYACSIFSQNKDIYELSRIGIYSIDIFPLFKKKISFQENFWQKIDYFKNKIINSFTYLTAKK